MDWFKMNIILFHMTLLFSNGSFTPITKEEVQSLLQTFQENLFQEWENKLGKSSLKQSLLCQVPVIKTGKNFVTFLYGNFLLRVLVNAVVWVFAIIIIGISTTALEFTIAVVVNSNNDYSKYPHYDIYQYSQREIPV